jgi:hypothetical protein
VGGTWAGTIAVAGCAGGLRMGSACRCTEPGVELVSHSIAGIGARMLCAVINSIRASVMTTVIAMSHEPPRKVTLRLQNLWFLSFSLYIDWTLKSDISPCFILFCPTDPYAIWRYLLPICIYYVYIN